LLTKKNNITGVFYRRLISEIITIKSHKNAINLQSDTELLQQSYAEILNGLNGHTIT